jgi:hypothetical protein
MIIDFDIHHGDGTQRFFEGNNNVLFTSIHRYGNFYPGTGNYNADFITIKDNLFNDSGIINIIKILEYLLAQIDPNYESFLGLQNDNIDFSNSIINRLNSIEQIISTGSGTNSYPDSELLPNGEYVLMLNKTNEGVEYSWTDTIDTGVWEAISE